MKKIIGLVLTILVSLNIDAQQPIVIDLWPDGAPNETGLSGNEEYDEKRGFCPISHILH